MSQRPAIGYRAVFSEDSHTASTGLPIPRLLKKFRWDGEPMRTPKKGEYFLSGAIPVAYYAPNDLTTEYWIAVRATSAA